MKRTIAITVFLGLLHFCPAPPVTEKKRTSPDLGAPHNESDIGGLEDYMEYHRYLKEVVNALESDPDFRQKLENAGEADIRSGKIAEELEFVSHHVRSRLDEIKRVELNRLRELTEKKRRLQEKINLDDPTHHHVDHANPHTFEIEDLKKLIWKTTQDLAEADKKRREEFKEYELQKEYNKQEKLNHTNGTEREKLEKEYQEREEKHKKHEKLHEPGHKAQLEEVWQEQDQMQQDFDPKTFFMLHDIDSNGLWDQDEVKALFVKELEKMYEAGRPEDDMREKAEELERMRETVFQEVDVNRDGFIDYQEFFAQTKRNDFKEDHGWQGLDEKRPYSDEELQEYIRAHQAQQMQYGQYPQYQVPPGGYQQVPPGYHPNNQVPPNYHPNQVPQQNYHPQGPQFHPGQVPQHPPQQIPAHLPDLNTNEIYPNHNKVPPAGAHPQGGYQQQHVPQGGYQQHAPQGGYQQHAPQGGYQQQQNIPQGGYQQQPQGGYQAPQKTPIETKNEAVNLHQGEQVAQQAPQQVNQQAGQNTNQINQGEQGQVSQGGAAQGGQVPPQQQQQTNNDPQVNKV